MADQFMRLEVTGLDGVLDTLKQLPQEVVSKRGGPVKLALAKGARMLRDALKQTAPVRTGLLKESIVVGRYRVMPNGELGEAMWVGPSKKFSRYANNRYNRGSKSDRGKYRAPRAGQMYEQDGPAYYGKFLEYGTKNTPARPWLRPTAEANAQRIVDTVDYDLVRRVDLVVNELARANGVPK